VIEMGKERPGILLATNGEPQEAASIRFAAAEAVRTGRPVTVVHVVHGSAPDPHHHLLEYSYPEVEKEGRRRADRIAGQLRDLTHGTVPVHAAVPRGYPVDRVVALSAKAHLVVLQRRESGRMARLVPGSTSAGIAARSIAPVVSVPHHWTAGRPFVGRVVLALGEQPDAWTLIGRAFEAATEHEAGLHVVRALDFPIEGTESAPALDRRRRRADAELETVLAPYRRIFPDIDVTVDVPEQGPAEALRLSTVGNDLLVIGRREVLNPAFEHLGKVTRAMLRTAECPVLVVPRPFADYVREAPCSPSASTVEADRAR
jgi:nucleotide-binding universal stress UspA family protein